MFLKEGVCQDYKFMEQLSKLLRFESSLQGEGVLVSFDDYLARCPPEQKNIYYLVAPSRSAALASPYFETFRKHGKEVLLLYNTIDDFVMSNLKTFNGKIKRVITVITVSFYSSSPLNYLIYFFRKKVDVS